MSDFKFSNETYFELDGSFIVGAEVVNSGQYILIVTAQWSLTPPTYLGPE